jgi:hypothetical protein
MQAQSSKILKAKKIIRFRAHSKRYILFEGTDLDIQTALIEAGNKISEVNDVTALLNKYFQFSPVFAKLYSYETGTQRFFEFKISEYPILKDIPTGEIDGFINLIFNSKIKIAEIQEDIKNSKRSNYLLLFQKLNRDKKFIV